MTCLNRKKVNSQTPEDFNRVSVRRYLNILLIYFQQFRELKFRSQNKILHKMLNWGTELSRITQQIVLQTVDILSE